MPIIPGVIILATLIVLGFIWIVIERYVVRRESRPAFLAELKTLADDGVLQARYVLAKRYFKFMTEPEKYMAQTAQFGHMDAQVEMMHYLLKGKVFLKDPSKAADWAEKAARQGSIKARHQLYLMYLKGISVKKDVVQAYYWLLMALEEPVRKGKLMPQEDILKFQKSKDKKTKALWRLHLEDWIIYRDEVNVQDKLMSDAVCANLEKKLSAKDVQGVQDAVLSVRRQDNDLLC